MIGVTSMKMFKENQRVRVKSIDIKGVITYIEQKDYFNHHMHPIQIELDKPYGLADQTMYRTNVKDIVGLKKKTKPKVDDDVIFDFS